MSALLKGGIFQNRYVFKAKLTAKSPLHIGSGEMIERPGLVDDKGKPLQISAVIVDAENKPYIPGSCIKGAIRDWLRLVKNMNDREDNVLKIKLTPDEIKSNAESLESLERLFGTIYSEGKLEIWDAPCLSQVNTPTDPNLSGWDKDRLTYVAKSVAINPETGTAEEHKLYNFELVPEGAKFQLALSGQNLSDDEVALILDVLDGFNHSVFPLTLGSMTKRGFGRFSISEVTVYKMEKNNISFWKELCENDNKAGYDSICREEFKMNDEKIAELKNKINYHAIIPNTLQIEWNLTLKTPLVIRSGSSFAWENAAKKKTRNYNMKYLWGHEASKKPDEHDISDLYFSLKINGNEVEPYYHIPSSSIRGSLREWTIKHLLPEDWWDIEGKLKEYAKQNPRPVLPKYLEEITSLFGFALETSDKSLNEKFNRAGRLTIEVEPFSGTQPQPDVHGTWSSSNNNYGPSNAKRHIKTRNPLDRITNAAKKGGLHSGLEFSREQNFKAKLIIKEPNDFDRNLIRCWLREINYGFIRFGALSSVGRGRVSAEEVQNAAI
ncbi:MAG: RAMP superfamily CRISPR-associated protein [Candidatus Jordarchaeaceae archaeon]